MQVCRWAACGQAGATTLAEYAYDPDGRRVWAKRSSEATYFFDGFDLTLTVGNPQGSGTILRHVAAGDRVVASTSVAEGNLLLAGVAPRGAPPVLLARVVAGSLVLLVVGVVCVGGPHTRAGRRIGVLRVGTTLVCFLLVQLPLPPAARSCEHPTDPLPDTYFYHPDRLGSTELLTTYEGAAYEYLRHQPFGDVVAFDPEGIAKTPASTFQFTGHRGDDGTGLSYFGARYYDPALGLFVSQDPAGQFFSPYSYGGGNPLAGTDPTGAEFSLLAVFIIALLSAVATVIDAAVQGASLGDALVAGVITFGTSVAGAYLGGIVGAAVQGLGPAYAPALQAGLAAVAVGSVAYGAYESFSNGRYASGAAIFLSVGIGYALSGKGDAPPAADQEREFDGALPETGVCSGVCDASSQSGPTYKPAPPELIGTRDYYIWRDANAPTDIQGDNYYTNYGLRKFDDFQALRAGASPELQGFIDRAGVELQLSLENALRSNPGLEFSRSSLLQAAFDTHSDAYVAAGFRSLPLGNQLSVARTVGVRDFFGAGIRAGFREAWQVYTAPAP